MLDPAILAQMVAAYESGKSIYEIGKQFNRHSTTVHYHLKKANVQLKPVGRYKKQGQ